MAAVASLPAETGRTRRDTDDDVGMQAWSRWGWLTMAVGMITFWGLVIWAIAAVFRSSRLVLVTP